MSTTIFFTTLRVIALPYVAFRLLANSFLDEKNAFLVVCIALTITIVFSIFLQILKLFSNIIFLKPQSAFTRFLVIAIEVSSMFGFWYYYFVNY
jgi:hypothetical protein